jgi:hypothetical protein
MGAKKKQIMQRVFDVVDCIRRISLRAEGSLVVAGTRHLAFVMAGQEPNSSLPSSAFLLPAIKFVGSITVAAEVVEKPKDSS